MEVSDTSQVLGNRASTIGELSESCTTWETAVDESAVGGSSCGCGDGNIGSSSDRTVRAGSCLGTGSHGKSREWSDGQVGTRWAGRDESSCESEHGSDSERSIKCRWNSGGLGGCSDKGLMSSFNGNNLSCNSQDRWGFDEGSGCEISGNSVSGDQFQVDCKTYAETPMFSNTPAVATIAAAVVNPKLYVHG